MPPASKQLLLAALLGLAPAMKAQEKKDGPVTMRRTCGVDVGPSKCMISEFLSTSEAGGRRLATGEVVCPSDQYRLDPNMFTLPCASVNSVIEFDVARGEELTVVQEIPKGATDLVFHLDADADVDLKAFDLDNSDTLYGGVFSLCSRGPCTYQGMSLHYTGDDWSDPVSETLTYNDELSVRTSFRIKGFQAATGTARVSYTSLGSYVCPEPTLGCGLCRDSPGCSAGHQPRCDGTDVVTCEPLGKCSESDLCVGPQWVDKPGGEDICPSIACDVEDCCDRAGQCPPDACGVSPWTPKITQPTHCAGASCTTRECCDRAEEPSVQSMPPGSVNDAVLASPTFKELQGMAAQTKAKEVVTTAARMPGTFRSMTGAISGRTFLGVSCFLVFGLVCQLTKRMHRYIPVRHMSYANDADLCAEQATVLEE